MKLAMNSGNQFRIDKTMWWEKFTINKIILKMEQLNTQVEQ